MKKTTNEGTPLLSPRAGYGADDGTTAATTATEDTSTKLNTFSGVFIPTSLNVLSILMFLRFGFIVGQLGIVGSLGVLALSYLIDALTVMSVSAIATNGTVKGGGAYYMISRSLGPEFGGSIGIIFFVGQVLNSALNVVGLIEPMLVNFGKIQGDLFPLVPVSYFWQVAYSTILLAACTGISMVGSNMVSKTALWLFIILVFSTLSIPASAFYHRVLYYGEPFYTGISWSTFKENLLPHFTAGAAGSVQEGPETFRNLFGIFFPATAGIYAGASMSGELKNPSKSIPEGTIKGLTLTFWLYVIVIISIGASMPRELLHRDIKVIQSSNILGYIIILGEVATALFSVIMGIVGASSLLTAIANDRIIPGLLQLATTKKSPRKVQQANFLAIAITWFLAQICLFADINQIAVFVTMAYLMTFIVTNLACFLLKLGSAPNFRPSFKYFNIQTAFFGLSISVVAMFIVDGMSASMVIIILFVLIILIHYSTPPSKFGDISQLLIYHQVRKYLLRLKVNMNVKYWRPQILLLVDSPRSSWNLIGFCNHLKKGGLYVLGHVVILNDDTISKSATETDREFSIQAYKEVKKQRDAWRKLRDISNIKAFVQIALGPSLPWGVRNVYLGSGLGGMKPNITVLGFYDFAKYGLQMPLPAFKNQSQFNQLPTDDCRQEQKVSISQWVQIIEDLIIMQSSVAVAANFNALDLPKFMQDSFWSRPWFGFSKEKVKNSSEKTFIDLYPIQMSSINVIDGKSILSTNFDTYTLILQLGSILSTVPEWKLTNRRLRIIVFVEHESEVYEEKRRLSELLATLRIEAKVKAICLSSGSLNSYNYIVKGYTKNATNKFEYDRIDKILKDEQWWKNLTNARDTLNQLEKQKLRKKLDLTQDDGFQSIGLTKPNTTKGNSIRNRRETISNLHDLGVSLSFNMRGGIMNYEDVESSSSSDDEDTSYPNSFIEGEPPARNEAPTPRSSQPVDKRKFNLSLKLGNNYLSSDQLSIKSSRSNLKPNFVSVKTPAAQLRDDDDENEGDNNQSDDLNKSYIGFVDDDNATKSGVPSELKEVDYFNLEKKKKSISKLRREKSGVLSPSIISNDDGIIHQLRTPQFLAVNEDDDDIPSLHSSVTDLPTLNTDRKQSTQSKTSNIKFQHQQESTTDEKQNSITKKQLQAELSSMSFDDIPAKGQHLILNELMRLHSPKSQTDVIFSTLPAPSLNTHLDDDESFDYTNNISIWMHELPPVLLINSQTVTVTTAL